MRGNFRFKNKFQIALEKFLRKENLRSILATFFFFLIFLIIVNKFIIDGKVTSRKISEGDLLIRNYNILVLDYPDLLNVAKNYKKNYVTIGNIYTNFVPDENTENIVMMDNESLLEICEKLKKEEKTINLLIIADNFSVSRTVHLCTSQNINVYVPNNLEELPDNKSIFRKIYVAFVDTLEVNF